MARFLSKHAEHTIYVAPSSTKPIFRKLPDGTTVQVPQEEIKVEFHGGFYDTATIQDPEDRARVEMKLRQDPLFGVALSEITEQDKRVVKDAQDLTAREAELKAREGELDAREKALEEKAPAEPVEKKKGKK